MPIRVITPPEPIVTPGDIPGDHAADDVLVASMIAAATEQIDGPAGWLGRAFGPQTLEFTATRAPWGRIALPCPPVISIEAVTFRANDASVTTLPVDQYFYDGCDVVIRDVYRRPLTVRYRAGYNGSEGAGPGEIQTGPLPQRVRQAIILIVQGLMAVAKPEDLRSFEVHDAYTKQYSSPELIQRCRTAAVDALLDGLKVNTI